MKSFLNIASRKNLEDLINCFLPEEIDCFYLEKSINKRGVGRYLISIRLNKDYPPQAIAERIAELIISKYENYLLNQILKQYFVDFSYSQTKEILKTARNSIAVFNKIYNKNIIVKNLTKLIEVTDHISIEGFLNFRTREYRRTIYMILSDAIEELYLKEEYKRYIEMIKSYISYMAPQIDLLHIKPNFDGSFSLYNFKMEEILFEIENTNSTEIFLTSQDMLMSILISLAPKRIIWHNTNENETQNIKLALSEIFGERLCICHGCKLCKDE